MQAEEEGEFLNKNKNPGQPLTKGQSGISYLLPERTAPI
nr:MAG TPA: hypothetical protein [Caudoviricetes sp.]